jgi:predicted nucleotidyltransferase
VGSQNYGAQTSKSEIDTKAIIIPSFSDILFSKPKSNTHHFENGEQIDIKDFRLMVQNFLKQNINFVEVLFTRHFIANPLFYPEIMAMREIRELIARYDERLTVNSVVGMMYEKKRRLFADVDEQYGCDPKQLHHIARLFEFLVKYTEGRPYSECIYISDPTIIEIKNGYFYDGRLNQGNAERLANSIIEKAIERKFCFTPEPINEKAAKELHLIVESAVRKVM